MKSDRLFWDIAGLAYFRSLMKSEVRHDLEVRQNCSPSHLFEKELQDFWSQSKWYTSQ